ncbi:MAG: hypothetical protein WAT79_11275 [Saprospiraceae bacterium]
MDYMKIKVTNASAITKIKEAIYCHPSVYMKPLELKYRFDEEKYGLNFILYMKDNNESLYITGSLHHFYNLYNFGKKQNYDDFTFTQMKVALYQMSDLINCDLRLLKVIRFEFGINIRCLQKPSYLINNILYLNGKVTPDKKRYNKNGGLQKLFSTDSYEVKIYDKSSESGLYKNSRLNIIEDLIRIEIVFLDSAYSQNYGGIYSLADFLSFEIVSHLYDLLLSHWSRILFLDSLKPESTFSDKEKAYFNQCCVIDYFADPNKVHFKGDGKKRLYRYNKFVTFLDNKNYRSDFEEVTKIIEAKCKYLLMPENEKIEYLMKKIFDKELDMESLPKKEIYDRMPATFGFGLTETEVVDIRLSYDAIRRLKDSGHL